MKERSTVQTSLLGIAKKAKSNKRYRFRNLYRELNEELLGDSWRLLRKDAALGVDQISAAEYEANLDENIQQLVERLKRKSYRAKLVRRHYIPKGEGKWRPLGIPAIEDKLLQLAVKRLLEAIYEQDFLTCSYGYRPRIGALEAVDQLTVKLQFGGYHHVVEADIKGFFDHLSHEWLMRMLAERIDDQAILRLIKKWLKAGVLDTDGKVLKPEGGTPQGGIISPILANVYLHYALDLWCKKNRHLRMPEQFGRLNAKLRGYYNYYGVNGNYASLNAFYHQLQRLHLKWLNRRSQCPSYTWDGYYALRQHFTLVRPYIVGRPKSCLVTVRG